MAFIFNGEEDYSGHPDEPVEALGSLLSHVEFDTVEDLYALAGTLKVNVDRIHLGSLPEGKAGCTHFYSDGGIDITLACHSVLTAVHEFAHVCRRKERDDHGEPFKKRMARLIEKAEAWLEGKVEVYQPEPEPTAAPGASASLPAPAIETVTTVEPIPEDVPLWQILDEAAA